MSSTSSATLTTTPFFSTLSTDLLLEIASFCNLDALTRLRACSRVWTVLTAEYEQSHPSFTNLVGTLPTLAAEAKRRCKATPSVGFLFSSSSTTTAQLTETLSKLPPHCQVIGGTSLHPFTGHGKVIVRAGGVGNDAVFSLLSLPEAQAQVFKAQDTDLGEVASAAPSKKEARRILRETVLGLDSAIDYKVFVIIPGAGAENIELLLHALQEGYPRAAIVGGVFARGLFCWNGGELQTPGGNRAGADGIVGMALWGNVPLQAVVSRGVIPSSPALKVANWEYDDEGDVVVVKEVYRPASSSSYSSAATEGTVNAYAASYQHMDRNSYMGLQIEVPQEEEASARGGAGGAGGGESEGGAAATVRHAPYELLSFEYALQDETPVLLLYFANKPQGPPPPNARLSIKLFELKAPAAQTHVQRKMKAVAQELRQKKQEVLGAFLFSCNGRGPRRFLSTVWEQVDARTFMEEFPDTPLSGMFAMGEIGPQATYVDDEEVMEGAEGQAMDSAMIQEGGQGEVEEVGSILRNSQSGSCALQGFTAVFALMVTPKRSAASSPLLTVLNTEGLAVAVRRVLERS